ncbi:MAG: thioredoxin family protein [Candidatus Aramenus sp.]|jgi:predicted thioredoxin/glutaredoxin|nr:thioredoxin family protein [Candidatus Aramenus sp.]
MKVEIFTHKNCTECNLLIEFLDQRGLLGKVQLIDTELYPFLAIERGVISTPSVFIDGKLVYAGTVDFEELARILSGERVKKEVNKEELVNKLMYGIVDSFAATAWLYVNRDFDSFMAQKDFLMAVTGLVLSDNAEEEYNYLRNVMLKEGEKYLEQWEEKMMRNISSNFVRELYWLYRSKLPLERVKSLYPIEVFAHWLMIRGASVGRVGVRIYPLSDAEVMKRILKVYNFMLSNYDALWEKVEKEQKNLEQKNLERKLII